MFFYIIYFLFSPILWIFIIVSSIFQFKIRQNHFFYYQRLRIIKKHLRDSNNKKKILLCHAASAGEYEQLKPLLRLINKNEYFIIQSFTSPTIYHKEKQWVMLERTNKAINTTTKLIEGNLDSYEREM